MNYCSNDDCFGEIGKHSLLCCSCLAQFFLISKTYCCIATQQCHITKNCWISTINAFHYYYMKSIDSKPSRQIILTQKDFSLCRLKLFPDSIVMNVVRLENIQHELNQKRPAFVIYHEHYFLLLGYSKTRQQFLLQSFCNHKMIIFSMQFTQLDEMKVYFCARLPMTDAFYDENVGGGDDVYSEESD